MKRINSSFVMLAIGAISVLGSGVAQAASGAATKSEQCEQITRIYNRCETHVAYDSRTNLVALASLGTSVQCDDGKDLPFIERLRNSDVSSMLSQPYTQGRIPLPVTTVNLSPGGIRNQDFIKAIYGADINQVRKNLVSVNFLGQQVLFNRLNGAAHQLGLVSQELMKIYEAGTDPKLNDYLKPFLGLAPCVPAGRCHLPGATFVWRVVKDTTALSNHSFGTAIDLQPASGTQYWLWDLKTQIKNGDAVFAPGKSAANYDPHDVLNFKPRGNPGYPETLVDVFERHGFIWGGKWYRYDVMHFEFRPEFFPNENLACK